MPELQKEDGKSSSYVHLWWLAVRPKTLPAAAAPVAVGGAAAYHDGVLNSAPLLACFLGALLLQVAVNLANDYFDAKNEIDSEARLGPVRVTQSGLIPPRHVFAAMVSCLVLAALVFGYLTLVGGMPIFWVGLASVLAALGYSGGPYPLASHGLGELFVFIFFGLAAVGGTYWVQALSIHSFVFAVATIPGLLISAIMVVNNLRDRVTDEPAGKRTLAVRLGETKTIRFYRSLIAVSYLLTFVLAVSRYGVPCLLVLATLPMGYALWGEIEKRKGAELNTTLARTAQFSLFFSLLLALGIMV